MKTSILLIIISLTSLLYSNNIIAQHSPVVFDVILCLDDRITAPNQIDRDKEIIKIIFDEFHQMVRHERFYINSRDVFRVLVAPQQGANYEVYGMATLLSIDLSKLSIAEKRRKMENFDNEITNHLDRLYDTAFQGPDNSNYNGANVWRYLNGEYQDEIYQDANSKIFLLTDGYLDFEQDEYKIKNGSKYNHTDFVRELVNDSHWRDRLSQNDMGLIPCDLDLSNSDVVVLEINPKTQGYFEGEVLKTIWEDWISAMGANKVKAIRRTSSIPSVDLVIN